MAQRTQGQAVRALKLAAQVVLILVMVWAAYMLVNGLAGWGE